MVDLFQDASDRTRCGGSAARARAPVRIRTLWVSPEIVHPIQYHSRRASIAMPTRILEDTFSDLHTTMSPAALPVQNGIREKQYRSVRQVRQPTIQQINALTKKN